MRRQNRASINRGKEEIANIQVLQSCHCLAFFLDIPERAGWRWFKEKDRGLCAVTAEKKGLRESCSFLSLPFAVATTEGQGKKCGITGLCPLRLSAR